MDLSVIIPARNEEFLSNTINSVLSNIEMDTEIIVILDGYWPNPGIQDNERITLIHHPKSIGQRAAVNQGAKYSRAKYIMKLDAHCDVDQGFDKKLIDIAQPKMTIIPRMYNLHAFDWECCSCGNRVYQGPYPESCEKCDNVKDFKKFLVWEKREKRYTDFWMFDNNLKFSYWNAFKSRPEAKKPIVEIMSNIGACFFVERERFLELGGLDENHGGWGQVGTEVSCKTWLSGGRLVVYKNTWFAHMFRTRKGFSFPYEISYNDQEKAREYSKDLWFGGKWEGQKKPLFWLVSKFAPVPTWNDQGLTIIYYTANKIEETIAKKVRENISNVGYKYPIISVSQKPIEFGENICVGDIGHSLLNVYKQVLVGVKAAKTSYVALVEDDCLYTYDHFNYRPNIDTIGYNINRWNLKVKKPVFYHRSRPVLSQCIAPREVLIKTLEERLALKDVPDKFCGEPGLYEEQLGISKVKYERFVNDIPNIVLCHKNDVSGSKIITKDTKDELPHWGKAVKVLESIGSNETPNIAVESSQSVGSGIVWRSQKSRIAGDVGYSVEDLYNNKINIIESGRDSVVGFFSVFEEFIDDLINGKVYSEEEIKETGYFKYLLTKLNPADRDPYTDKGIRHCINKFKNAIKLFEDIKERGLGAPLTFYKIDRKRIVIFRGARRLVILYKLGIKEAALRIFKSKDDIRRYDGVVDKWHMVRGNRGVKSIHELGMEQFLSLGGRSTDKYWVHGYLSVYDKLFSHLRRSRIKILELGLLFGASLALWHRAFPKALIYGVDKNITTWKRYIKDLDRISVFVGKQEDKDFLNSEVVPNGKFNIIIDDCGHIPEMQWASFETLWPSVKNGGFYVIEDCWHSYEREGISIPKKISEYVDEIYKGKILSIQMYYNLCILQKGF